MGLREYWLEFDHLNPRLLLSLFLPITQDTLDDSVSVLILAPFFHSNVHDPFQWTRDL